MQNNFYDINCIWVKSSKWWMEYFQPSTKILVSINVIDKENLPIRYEISTSSNSKNLWRYISWLSIFVYQTNLVKISINWLKDYLETDHTPEEISEILTNLGLEVEKISDFESIEGGLKGVVAGKVLECAMFWRNKFCLYPPWT